MRESTPSREESRALARTHALIPIYREVLADMLTPVLAYTLLCPPDSPGFLLESVEGGERLARYSFIGYQPKQLELGEGDPLDRKSTRLNSSHVEISYAVFCLKKKKKVKLHHHCAATQKKKIVTGYW